MNNNDVIFFEHYAAAQSMKNIWTRLASTYGCMMVVLSRDTLTIKPHWFAKWFIRLLGLDLYHIIPISNISGIKETGKWFSYGKVELDFVTTDGQKRRIMLIMRKYRNFIDMVNNVISR